MTTPITEPPNPEGRRRWNDLFNFAKNVWPTWMLVTEISNYLASGSRDQLNILVGEVVEEIQHLRELLIRSLSEPIFSMPARQSMAVLLRLNRIVDKGISHAVVGYTDELVETLFDKRGVPVTAAEPADVVIDERLDQLENELLRLKLDHTT